MAEDYLLSSKDHKLTLYESLALASHSQVFRGELVLLGQQPVQVAAKKVRLAGMDIAEISALKNLNHKNIIKFYGVYAFDDVKTFIIMALAEEGNLFHFLMRYRMSKERVHERSCLPEPLIWKWVLEAASAIQYLHSQSKIHRDIKSQNYLISASFTLKLGDLGMAKRMDATQPTLGHGTCGWMAPEVIQHQRRSRKSDVFSFGVVAWEICSTEVPYCDIKGDFRVMRAVCDGERPPIPEGIPEKLTSIVEECWECDYNKRPEMDAIVVKLLPFQMEVDLQKLLMETSMQAWEICSTEVPYCDIKGDFRVMRAVCDGERPPIPEGIPEKLTSIVEECWECDYNKRPEMDAIVVKLLPFQMEVDLQKLLMETSMQDARLEGVRPPASVTKLEPDGKDVIPLRKVLTDKRLLELAGQLGHEWEQLGTYLEFEGSEMFRLKSEHQMNMLTAIHKMLISWRQRQDPDHGAKQVVENLSQALNFVRRKDLSTQILEWIPNK